MVNHLNPNKYIRNYLNNIDQLISLYLTFFSQEDNIRKVSNTFNDNRMAKRHQRRMVNIQITFLAWVAEILGFFFIVFGTFILGHENNIANYTMQNITVFIYFNILPAILILNNSMYKERILKSKWYGRFLTVFKWQYNNRIDVLEN